MSVEQILFLDTSTAHTLHLFDFLDYVFVS